MGATLIGEFVFDGSDPLYEGHFPGNPVVPGSLVVEAFVMRLQAEGLVPCEVKNFRFRAFVPPGTCGYEVTVETGRAVCTLFHGDQPAVTGEVIIR